MALLSIIIPCYNAEKFIDRCLESCLKGDSNIIEIICVNDGSQDNTLEIITNMQMKYENIKVIDIKNKGVMNARYIGYLHSTTENIFFLDADDYIVDNFIEKVYRFLYSKTEELLIFNYKYVYLNKENNSKIFGGKELIKDLLLNNINSAMWNKIFKRKIIKDIYFKELESLGYGEDIAFMVLVAKQKPKYKIIDDILYFYIINKDSITNSKKSKNKKILDVSKGSNYIQEYLSNESDEYKEEIEYFYYYHNCYCRIIDMLTLRKDIRIQLYNIWKNSEIDITKNKYYKNNKRDKFIKFIMWIYPVIKKVYFW
ncbi:glycosyltransferase family A protein [uncultured Clostridium sp.]|uniref:glycosyltransferase family 2 protein n=1 Tax=uncultured Clostridium sp. TaxID=59620 RepID=UPI0026174ED4|nr:glycosyltransferase family A protein [uncultured Clostridium sp.]